MQISNMADSPMCTDFKSLGLHGWLIKQCKEMGITKPTDIQKNTVPEILRGRNCIGCAKTGSGKTAAFALPILQKLSEDPFGIFAVILTPTRYEVYSIINLVQLQDNISSVHSMLAFAADIISLAYCRENVSAPY